MNPAVGAPPRLPSFGCARGSGPGGVGVVLRSFQIVSPTPGVPEAPGGGGREEQAAAPGQRGLRGLWSSPSAAARATAGYEAALCAWRGDLCRPAQLFEGPSPHSCECFFPLRNHHGVKNEGFLPKPGLWEGGPSPGLSWAGKFGERGGAGAASHV